MMRTSGKSAFGAATNLTVPLLTTGASAEPYQTNLGPVGPREPILATVGEKRVIAYYTKDGKNCEVSAIVFDKSPTGGGHASSRVDVALRPGELLHLGSVKEKTVALTCGRDAKKMGVVYQQDLAAASVNYPGSVTR